MRVAAEAPHTGTERPFGFGSRVVLAVAVFLVSLSLAQLLYRVAQPTDGWTIETSPSDELVLDANLLGAPSPLRNGDVVIAIGGQSPSVPPERLLAFENRLPTGWTASATIPYTVRRHEQVLTVPVSLHTWRVTPLLLNLIDPFNLGVAILAVIASFTFAQRPDNWGARALFMLTASLLTMVLSSTVSQAFDPLLATAPLTLFCTYLSWSTLIWPSFFLLTLSFPRPKLRLARHPLLALVLIYGAAPVTLALTGNPLSGWLLVIVWAALSLLAVAHSAWTVRDPVGQAQLRWAAAGVAAGALGMIANNVVAFGIAGGWLNIPDKGPDWLQDLPGTLSIVAPALGFAIAILRYHLFDIDVIIRRTLVYSVLTALLAGVYLGSVIVLQYLTRNVFGQAESPLAVVVSTLIIAVLFAPLRTGVQAGIDRRFFRRKYDATQTLAAFAHGARNETDLQTLSDYLVEVVVETMQPESVSLWLKPAANRQRGIEK